MQSKLQGGDHEQGPHDDADADEASDLDDVDYSHLASYRTSSGSDIGSGYASTSDGEGDQVLWRANVVALLLDCPVSMVGSQKIQKHVLC